jgi:hypothetical protein
MASSSSQQAQRAQFWAQFQETWQQVWARACGLSLVACMHA